jgi:hypothetical protein
MDPKLEAALAAADIDPETTAKVIAALQAADVDPSVGTVLRNPANGDTALFVRQYTETYWRVVSVDDRSWTVFGPLVGWDVLHQVTVEPEVVDEDDS